MIAASRSASIGSTYSNEMASLTIFDYFVRLENTCSENTYKVTISSWVLSIRKKHYPSRKKHHWMHQHLRKMTPKTTTILRTKLLYHLLMMIAIQLFFLHLRRSNLMKKHLMHQLSRMEITHQIRQQDHFQGMVGSKVFLIDPSLVEPFKVSSTSLDHLTLGLHILAPC